jgi:hypothetical protein
LLYGRRPAPDEVGQARQFLTAAGAALPETFRDTGAAGDKHEVWASLMRVLLSSNEFLTLD